jgi:hypothetical protein
MFGWRFGTRLVARGRREPRRDRAGTVVGKLAIREHPCRAGRERPFPERRVVVLPDGEHGRAVRDGDRDGLDAVVGAGGQVDDRVGEPAFERRGEPAD